MYEGNVSHRVAPVGLGQRHSRDASDTSMATTLSPCTATQHWSQPHLCQAGQFECRELSRGLLCRVSVGVLTALLLCSTHRALPELRNCTHSEGWASAGPSCSGLARNCTHS